MVKKKHFVESMIKKTRRITSVKPRDNPQDVSVYVRLVTGSAVYLVEGIKQSIGNIAVPTVYFSKDRLLATRSVI
jgi:hypothetical protein